MRRPEKSLKDNERERVRAMDINCLTVFVFRWLKENLDDYPHARDYCSVGNLRQYLFPGGPRDNNSADDHIKLSEAIVTLERKTVGGKSVQYSSEVV